MSDTLELSKKFKAGGFGEEQASDISRILFETFSQRITAKDDVEIITRTFKQDIENLEQSIKKDEAVPDN